MPKSKKPKEFYENMSPDLPDIIVELRKILAVSVDMHRRECLEKTINLLAGRQNHLDRMA